MKWAMAIIALALSAPAQASELLVNGDFDSSGASTTLTAIGAPAYSAATNWTMWNNTDAVTTSSVLASFEGRTDVLHISTTGLLNGAVQFFAGGAHVGYADIWVQSGRAVYLAALNGSGIQLSPTSTTGVWERVFLDTGSDVFNEVTLYSYDGAADFYVAFASAGETGAAPLAENAAVPEPSTWAMIIFGFGALGATMRRRKEQVRVRFA